MAEQTIEEMIGEMNHTELVEMAKFIDVPQAHAGMSRDELVDCIINLRPSNSRNPVDVLRKKLHTWLLRHWNRFEGQKLKPICPDCFAECSDMQSLYCYKLNEDQIR